MNKKKVIYILVVVLVYFFSFIFTIKYYVSTQDNTKLLKSIINNNGVVSNNKKIFGKIITTVANIDIKNPLTMIYNNYSFSNKNSSDDNKVILPKNNYVKDPEPNNKIDKPIVYLYNTHQSEEYKSKSSYEVKPTVMTVSYILREMLNKNGINTIAEENDVLEFLRTNNWNYASSYKVTRMLLDDIKEKEPTLKYFIDLHRDSVTKNISTININGKEYAKLLFIVGLENPNYSINLKFTEELNNMLDEMYHGLSRGIYKKKGPGVNGVYNQDFDPNTILIEVGGEENTIDEIYNSCLAISNILTLYIKGDSNET